MAWASEADVERWFTYKAPSVDQVGAMRRIRDKAKGLALEILVSTPASADQSAALRLVRESVMTANAAIVCARPSAEAGPNSYLAPPSGEGSGT